jgi:hypothetical protein
VEFDTKKRALRPINANFQFLAYRIKCRKPGTMLIMWIKILEIFTLINALACDKIHKIN